MNTRIEPWRENAVNLLDPISPYLTLIDRIITLLQTRKKRKLDYFEKIIDPLYTEFVPLAENMISLFRDAHASLMPSTEGEIRGNAGNDISVYRMVTLTKKRMAKLNRIKEKREEYALARAKLRSLLEVTLATASSEEDREVASFVESMLRFFNPQVGKLQSAGSSLVDILEKWVDGHVSRKGRIFFSDDEINDKLFVSEYAAKTLKTLEASWYEIAGRYMALKLKNVV